MVSAWLPRTASRTAAAAWLSTGAGSSTADSCPWVDRARRGFDLRDRAARRLGVDHAGHVDQRAQRDEDTGGLRRGQPQRMVDTRGERDLDGVAGELEVDQVTGAVAGQPAHPQLVEVVAQLLLCHAEVRCGLGVGDPRVGLEIRHHVQQSDQPLRNGAHADPPPPVLARSSLRSHLRLHAAARAPRRAVSAVPARRRRRRSSRFHAPAGRTSRCRC